MSTAVTPSAAVVEDASNARGADQPGGPAGAVEVFGPRQTSSGRGRRLFAKLSWPLGIYTVPVLLLVVWQLASVAGLLPDNIAPAPTAVFDEAVAQFNSGTLTDDILLSLQRAGLGFVLGLSVAIPVAIFAGLKRAGEMTFNGIFQIVNTIPLLAILPLMVVWFGIDELSKVVLISLGAALPMYLNLTAAIRGVDHRYVEMAQVAGASRGRVLARVILPGSLPGFLVGLRFSLAYSLLGLVAAETVNADVGVGHMIMTAQTFLRSEGVFLGLVIYAVLGLLADQVVRLLERSLLSWRSTAATR